MKQFIFDVSVVLILAFIIFIEECEFNNYKKDQQKIIQVKSDSIKTLLSDVNLLKNDFGYKIHNIWKETGISIPNDFDSLYLDSIGYYSDIYKIPNKIVYRIIWHESRFIPTVYNKSGATGLFQMKKCYWYEFRDDETEWNEFNRIKVALKGLRKIYNEVKRWDLAISIYGCGYYNKSQNKPAEHMQPYVNYVLNLNIKKEKKRTLKDSIIKIDSSVIEKINSQKMKEIKSLIKSKDIIL